ncbi:hypothetical protein [Saccharothrix xinjiangensis]|uniref:Uncharacterized protein n=1 Tax=Saccharothrix xinjiangensis TaxID=204798 RepID=A0ABV9XZY6_9PSEU
MTTLPRALRIAAPSTTLTLSAQAPALAGETPPGAAAFQDCRG